MTITESKKQSDLEKRLKLLRRQVYGKEEFKGKISTNSQPIAETSSSDISYLYQDLIKILTLSSLAIGAQLILFFLSKNHILNLNFL